MVMMEMARVDPSLANACQRDGVPVHDAPSGAAGRRGQAARLSCLARQGVLTAKLRETVSWAREVCGANGIVVDYNVGRYFSDAEALYSYEGTFQMQNLIVGKAVSGFSAFV